MSAYIRLVTPMTDRECLLQALADMGFGQDRVEVSEKARNLVGYRGDKRQQTADVVIPRAVVGPASNDIGFEWTPNGYRALISRYDSTRFGPTWLAQLAAHYQRRWQQKQRRLEAAEKKRLELERQRLVEAQRKAVYERARKMGYSVKESRQGQSVRLVLVKRSY